jgi:iron uptake system component EfeO
MSRPSLRLAAPAVLALTSVLGLAACTDKADSSASSTAGGAGGPIVVNATDTACELSASSAKAGTVTFQVSNAGTKVNEFYVYAEGDRIMGEVENVAPGLTRTFHVDLSEPGSYQTACKPGMVGDGIRAAFNVTGASAATKSDDENLKAAVTEYQRYVASQSDAFLAETTAFVELVKAGKVDEAKALYPTARSYWERIEPVAESFGDLDPKMDAREADLEEGQEWTGWHRIEKDLWPPKDKAYTALTPEKRKDYAERLLQDTQTLHGRIEELTFTVDQIGNGAKSLLDEVATGKVTGEEEIWSHTDLYDFQANVDGARVAFEGLRPVLKAKEPALEKQLEQRFTALEALLDKYRVGAEGFVSYDELTTDQVKELSDAVNALSEPLSHLTAAVTL